MKSSSDGILIFKEDLHRSDIAKIKTDWRQLYRKGMKSCNIIIAGKKCRYIQLGNKE